MCVYSYMFGLMKARRKSSVVRVGLLLVALLVSVFFVGGTAWADSGEYFGFLDIKIAPDNNKKCATVLSFWCDEAENDGEATIKDIIIFAISILSVGIGLLATIGFIICGYMIMTAKGNEGQVALAKKRMVEIVIGILLWAAGALLLVLFIPDEETPGYVNSGAIIKIKEIK